MDELNKTERSRLRRVHERGHFDREAIYAVLDAGPMCHVGYIIDGQPLVTPTFQWREGNHVYWHGSAASRMIRSAVKGDVCLTVSHLDGYVIARSAMHHSANYRSVMLFGRPEVIDDPARATAHLKTFVDGLFPGRWDTLRPMSDQELKATTVLSMPIEEGAAKIRTGPPKDDEEDYSLPIWAGVLPITQVTGETIACPRLLDGVEVPDHVRNFKV